MAIARIDTSNNAVHDELARHYRNEGLSETAWHIGPEHPALERAALQVLLTLGGRSVLEVGFQAGGFAVPIICALHQDPSFRYIGVDNLAYTNSVRPDAIERFLQPRVTHGCYQFVRSNSTMFLKTLAPGSVDLVLLDHFKPLYERDLLILCDQRIVKHGGAILLHDVDAGAAHAWRNCQHLVRTFQLSVELRADVPTGLAILRTPSASQRSRLSIVRSRLLTTSRAVIDDSILHARRAIGRSLRRARLRR